MCPKDGEVPTILMQAMLKQTQALHSRSLKNPPAFIGGFFVWKRLSAFVFLLLLIPLTLYAQVFSEIMYDTVGADSDEWVEIYNNTNDTINTKDLKLTEGNSNHSLKLMNGNALLTKGSYAVIAQDAVLFMSEHPLFSNTLFDSSFALSNIGVLLSYIPFLCFFRSFALKP